MITPIGVIKECGVESSKDYHLSLHRDHFPSLPDEVMEDAVVVSQPKPTKVTPHPVGPEELSTVSLDVLIPVSSVAGNPFPVNARSLHEFMEVGKDFSNWIKDRIEKYEFIEGTDYSLDSPNLANQVGHGGDRKTKDYYLSLNMAKELSMLQNNEQGRQARKYFIKCEEQLIACHGRIKRRLCCSKSAPSPSARNLGTYPP